MTTNLHNPIGTYSDAIYQRAFTYKPATTPLNYIYVDADIIIVDKPSGLLSVPGKQEPDCLEKRVQSNFSDSLTIHRLDMATSGVMVFARNKNAQRHIGLQFEKRHIEKYYVACVSGHVTDDTGMIDLPLICDWPNRPRQKVCFKNGKPASTAWKVVMREASKTRVMLMPKTGRSHQLRVHMLALGHPILGDRIYANDLDFKRAERLLLHSETIKLRHPSGGHWLEFTAPCPF